MGTAEIAGVFREYDLRGIAGEELSRDFARRLGEAYAGIARTKLGKKERERLVVSVGRDVRPSSDCLRDGLVDGLLSAGADVVDIGVCPTPLLYYSLFFLEVDGGIMITGSHNPPEYNGFKVCVGRETIHGHELQELKKAYLNAAPATAKRGTLTQIDPTSPYQDHLKQSFGAGSGAGLKVAVDAGNGTGGLVAPKILKALGCEVVPLFCEPDGRFPNHHPDPTVPAFLEDLVEAVVDQGCDFGLAYDGDADRLGVISDKGEILWGDRLMILFARAILEERPGATFIGEVKCSQTMYDEIARLGGNPIMWKTGHSLIKDKVKEVGASLAGEMSGHFFFADRYYGYDDAIYASCRLVELAKKAKESGIGSISELLKNVPQTFFTPEIRLDCFETKQSVIERLRIAVEGHRGSGAKPKINDVIEIDGLRVVFENGWGLVRASNTQPVLVLRFEATEQGDLDAIQRFFYQHVPGQPPIRYAQDKSRDEVGRKP